MIRIRYTFNTADGRVSWNDFLSSKDSVTEVLAEFAKIGPKFMLQNLVDMRLFEIIPFSAITGYQETQIQGIENDIAHFIVKSKEQ